jgi:hypothetical protein
MTTNLKSYNIKFQETTYQLDIIHWWRLGPDLDGVSEPFSIKLSKLVENQIVWINNKPQEWQIYYTGELYNNHLDMPVEFQQACLFWLKDGGFAGLDLYEYLRAMEILSD